MLPTYQCRRCKRGGFGPWVGKIPWSTKWQPAPVFLPGKFHGQRSLVGYSMWGCKKSDTTEWLSTHTHTHTHTHMPGYEHREGAQLSLGRFKKASCKKWHLSWNLMLKDKLGKTGWGAVLWKALQANRTTGPKSPNSSQELWSSNCLEQIV